MDDPSLQWMPDGFRFQCAPAPTLSVPLRTLFSTYLLGVPAVIGAMLDPVFVPLLLVFLAPLPLTLLSAVLTRGPTRLQVDHRRIVIDGPFGLHHAIPLRTVQRVEVREDGLEIALESGRRMRVPAGASGPWLWWLADRIHELREDVQRFEADHPASEATRIRGLRDTLAVRRTRADRA